MDNLIENELFQYQLHTGQTGDPHTLLQMMVRDNMASAHTVQYLANLCTPAPVQVQAQAQNQPNLRAPPRNTMPEVFQSAWIGARDKGKKKLPNKKDVPEPAVVQDEVSEPEAGSGSKSKGTSKPEVAEKSITKSNPGPLPAEEESIIAEKKVEKPTLSNAPEFAPAEKSASGPKSEAMPEGDVVEKKVNNPGVKNLDPNKKDEAPQPATRIVTTPALNNLTKNTADKNHVVRKNLDSGETDAIFEGADDKSKTNKNAIEKQAKAKSKPAESLPVLPVVAAEEEVVEDQEEEGVEGQEEEGVEDQEEGVEGQEEEEEAVDETDLLNAASTTVWGQTDSGDEQQSGQQDEEDPYAGMQSGVLDDDVPNQGEDVLGFGAPLEALFRASPMQLGACCTDERVRCNGRHDLATKLSAAAQVLERMGAMRPTRRAMAPIGAPLEAAAGHLENHIRQRLGQPALQVRTPATLDEIRYERHLPAVGAVPTNTTAKRAPGRLRRANTPYVGCPHDDSGKGSEEKEEKKQHDGEGSSSTSQLLPQLAAMYDKEPAGTAWLAVAPEAWTASFHAQMNRHSEEEVEQWCKRHILRGSPEAKTFHNLCGEYIEYLPEQKTLYVNLESDGEEEEVAIQLYDGPRVHNATGLRYLPLCKPIV